MSAQVGRGDSRIENPGDDGEPGNLAVDVGDLATPEDGSLAERHSEGVQHLCNTTTLSNAPSSHLRRQLLVDASKLSSNPFPFPRSSMQRGQFFQGFTGTKRPMAITNQNHLTVVTTDTAPR